MKLTIERLGHHGDGIARSDEGTVFVPAMLPGEEVEGTLQGDRLEGARILTPSAHRRKAPCPHYRSCGGCSLQHAHDDFVADWKAGVVLQALAAQGITARVGAIHTSPPNSRRRATLSARRTKAGVTLGFHMRGSDQVIAVPGCLLLSEDLKALFPALEEITKLGASRKGELSLTVTPSSTGADVAVTGGKPLDPELIQGLGALAEKFNLARITWEGEPAATRTTPLLTPGTGVKIPLPPGAFLQATREGEAALVAAVLEITKGAKKIVDLFAGCGTFALPLALKADVHAVEGVKALTQALDQGFRLTQGTRMVTTETRDLFRNPLIADELKFDAAVIDPPRAGAEAQIAELARAQVPVIAMVSCNPITFARDAKALIAAGYQMSDLTVVDQFRWSPHVEMLAAFRR